MLLVTILMALLLILNMKNISKYIVYILIGIAGIAIGFTTTKLFSKCKAETVFVPGEIVLKDTCINRLPIVTVETQDTFKQDVAIKEGKPVKVKDSPPVVEVTKKDSILTTHYKKSYDWGLVKLNLAFNVEATSGAKIKNFEIDYKLDTAVINNVYTKTNTIILKDTMDESRSIKYLPIVDKNASYGIQGGLLYIDKLNWKLGGYYETKTKFRISPQIIFKGYVPDGFNVDIGIPLSTTKK